MAEGRRCVFGGGSGHCLGQRDVLVAESLLAEWVYYYETHYLLTLRSGLKQIFLLDIKCFMLTALLRYSLMIKLTRILGPKNCFQ